MLNNRIAYRLDNNGTDTPEIDELLCSLGVISRFVSGGIAGIERLRDREPGCLLLDIDDPCLDIPAIFDTLTFRRAHVRVIVISAQADFNTVVDVMRLGACDYLLKSLDRPTMAASLHRVLDRLHSEMLVYERRQRALGRIDDLTDREQDVLRGLLAGQANKTLAYDLGLSIRTVEMHRSHLMARLEVDNLAQAIRVAFDAGLELDEARPQQQRLAPPLHERRALPRVRSGLTRRGAPGLSPSVAYG